MHNPARKIFRAGTGILAAAIAAGILMVSAAAYAACTSPAGEAGAIEWFSGTTQYKLCDGTNWNIISLDTTSQGACSSSAAREWNSTSKKYKICSGAGQNITSGLVGHWKLDENSGTTASNSASTGSGYNAVFAGSPAWIAGKISNGMDFNEGGGYNNLRVLQNDGYDSTLNPQHLTIAFWARLSSLYAGDAFITKGCGGASNCANWVYQIYDNGNGTINFVRSVSNTLQILTSTNKFSVTGVWHHVAATYDGSAMRIYVDGALDASLTGLADDGPGSNSDLAIGARYPQGGYGINGDMDDVRIYDRALNATEIQALYDLGSTSYKNINCASGIAFDAVSSSGANQYQANPVFSWSHTVGSSANRIIFICTAMLGDTTSQTVNAVTVGGNNATKIRSDKTNNADFTTFETSLWYYIAPPSGSQTIQVTFSGTYVWHTATAQAISFSNVAQTSPIDAHNGATRNIDNPGPGSTTLSTAVTTVTDNAWIVDCAYGDNALTVGSGQTQRAQMATPTGGAIGYAAISTVNGKTPAGSETMDWTQSSSYWTLSAAAFKPASSGCVDYGSCSTEAQMNYTGGNMLYCDGTNWRAIKAP